MEARDAQLSPRQYDDKRLNLFYNRALHRGNMPNEYRPRRGIVDKATFADAIIGLYLDQAMDETISQRLTRAAFALEFLDGRPSEELTSQFTRIEDRDETITQAREYALGVAGIGAKSLFDDPYGLIEAVHTAESELDKESALQNSEMPPDLEQYADLGEFIRQLHHDERLASDQARALLLLLRQAHSSAPQKLQTAIVTDMAAHLKRRLRHTTIRQPHKQEQLADPIYRQGKLYLERVLANPRTMLIDGRVYQELVHIEYMKHDGATPETAYRAVLGHIGYVLDKVYPAAAEE